MDVLGDVVRIEGARKSFGATEALKGLTMALRSGEMLALLGPNGAGKTTLIRALAGRVRLDSGAVTLFGRTLAPAAARPELGVVPQELALYPLLSARENLEVFGTLQGVPAPRLRERVRWALEWTGLAERSRDLVRTFSGGMKRRLNLACGVLHEPKVVLLCRRLTLSPPAPYATNSGMKCSSVGCACTACGARLR